MRAPSRVIAARTRPRTQITVPLDALTGSAETKEVA